MKKVTLKIPKLFLIPGHRINPVAGDIKAEYALAYLTPKRANEAREEAKERLATPVHYGLTEQAQPTTAKLASLAEFWALIDLSNAEPWEKDGRAYVFIFATRQAARDYKEALTERRKTKPGTIDVTAPVRYYVQ
jgi:hypothetical protein